MSKVLCQCLLALIIAVEKLVVDLTVAFVRSLFAFGDTLFLFDIWQFDSPVTVGF